MAVQTIVGLYSWGIVSFTVKFSCEFKDLLWTIFNTIAATLAPVLNDEYHTFCDLDIIGIKWNPPEFHGPFLYHSNEQQLFRIQKN